jgi:subfamily B ATP-binding cassette protein MsbA
MAEPKPQLSMPVVWREARDLVWAHRRRLSLGLALLLVNRLSGLVLPATSKYLIDDVIGKRQGHVLGTLALAAGAAVALRYWNGRRIVQVEPVVAID